MGNAEKGIEGFQPEFEKLFKEVYQLNECELDDYFTEVQIQHNPDYAYGEVIAAQIESTEDRLSLKRSYRTFVDRLVNSPSPWMKAAVSVENAETPARTIMFDNRNTAQLIKPTLTASTKDISQALRLTSPSALVLVIGVGDVTGNGLSSLLGDILPGIVVDIDALVVDSGVERGAGSRIAAGIALRRAGRSVLGIAPAGLVTYPGADEKRAASTASTSLDSNHTHFVLVDGDAFGDESDIKLDLVKYLAGEKPVIAVLAGDGAGARKELLRVVKQSWPIVVLEGSGELPDEISALSKLNRKGSEFSRSADALLMEIIRDGKVSVLPKNGPRSRFEQMIYACLPAGPVLNSAWRRFYSYEKVAITQRRTSRAVQLASLAFGCTTVFATLAPLLLPMPFVRDIVSAAWWYRSTIWHWSAIVSAMIMVVLLVVDSVSRPGVLADQYTNVAEAIRSEIFQYRSRSGRYSSRNTVAASPESRLVKEIESVEKETPISYLYPLKIESSEAAASFVDRVESGPLGPYRSLRAEQYVASRLEPMLSYELAQARAARRLRQVWWLAITLVATSGLSAAVALKAGTAIVAITTVFAIAGMGVLGIYQPDRKERTALAIRTALGDVLAKWTSLPVEQRVEQKNVDELVAGTETALRMGWHVAMGRTSGASERTPESISRVSTLEQR
jgi:hypothetical protein